MWRKMKSTMFKAVVVLLLVVSCVSSDVGTQDTISCTSPGTVLEGVSEAVTCHFHQDLQADEQDFYIYRSQNDQDPVIVAICAWEEDNSELACDYKTGYSVTVQASRVTLNITSALPFHAGKYSCSTLPPTPGVEIKPCNLTVQEKRTTTTTETKVRAFCRNDGQEASVTCIYPDSLHTLTLIIEKHDLTTKTKPVEVMRYNTQEETCTTFLDGYQPINNRQMSDNFKTVGVTIPSYATDKSGLYVCKTDSDSIASDMCILKSFQVSTRQDTETEAVGQLVIPLYAILVCILLFLVLALAAVIYRCRRREQNGQQPPLLKNTDRNV